jgi:hypothetical protein
LGYLSAIRDLAGTTTIQTFRPIELQQDMGVARRSGAFAILGADGAINPYGVGAPPLAAHLFAVTIRIFTTRAGGTAASFDAARDQLVRNIMHGRPQTLVYTADDGTLRFNVGYFVDAPSIVTTNSPLYHDFKLVWELDDPYWRSQFPADALIWGATGKRWGDVTLPPWGSTAFSLATNPTAHTVDATGNVQLGAPSAPDKGPVITIIGPFGGDGGLTVFNDHPNAAFVTASGATAPMQFSITEKVLAGVHYVVDCGARSVRKDGAPAYNHFTVPSYQDDWMRVEPNVANPFRFVCVGANTTAGGTGTIVYYLKFL